MSASTIPAGQIPATQDKRKRSVKGKLIGAIGLLVVAAIVAVGSGANFTAHTANPGNMVTEGAFSMSNSKPGQAIFAPQTFFDPGDTVEGNVTIGNAGTEAGDFSVKGVAEAGSDEDFTRNIHIRVLDYDDAAHTNGSSVDRPGAINYSGSLYNFINGCQPNAATPEKMPNDPTVNACTVTGSTYGLSGWSLHNWNSGENHYYRFVVDNNAANSQSGSVNGNDPTVAQFFNKTAKFSVNWDAVSTA